MLMATSFATPGHSSAPALPSGGTVTPLPVNGDFYASVAKPVQTIEVHS